MNKLIYLIDDDEDVRGVMTYALENEGFRVEGLVNGKEAIEKLSQLNSDAYPSLIITDYLMPEMDGLEFIEHIKENYPETLGKIPIAFSSARGTFDEEVEVPKDIICINKPMNLTDLIQLAHVHCQG